MTPLALGSETEAQRWLEEAGGDAEARETLRDRAVALLNQALHAFAATSGDPYARAISPTAALDVRIGYGGGDELVEGRWRGALDLPTDSKRRRRDDELAPQTRVAAVLGRRESLDACETLVPRARLDLDAGRTREAALQIRVGLEALLAELGPDPSAGQAEDLGTLDALRSDIGAAANAALRGDLAPDQEAAVGEAVSVSERVLRRRRLREG